MKSNLETLRFYNRDLEQKNWALTVSILTRALTTLLFCKKENVSFYFIELIYLRGRGEVAGLAPPAKSLPTFPTSQTGKNLSTLKLWPAPAPAPATKLKLLPCKQNIIRREDGFKLKVWLWQANFTAPSLAWLPSDNDPVS